MDDDLLKLPVAVRIARKTLSIVRQNVVFALGVKLLVLILSAVAWPICGRQCLPMWACRCWRFSTPAGC